MTNLITTENIALKQRVIKYIWPISSSFFIGYILLSFFVTHHIITGWILVANFLFFIVTLLIYFKTQNVKIVGNTLATIGMPVLLPWLFDGGPSGSAFWWSLVYVVWAFIVANKKTALFLLLLHLFLTAVIVILSHIGLYKIAYSTPTLLNFAFAYLTEVLYVYYLVTVIDHYLELSQKRLIELEKVNSELESANIISEQSKASKQLFLASMSHEIRTPLNAIIGFQQLLKDTNLNKEQQEYVESIDFAGRNLLVIINDILDISKMEVGKFEFDEIEFNVGNTIKSVVELVNQRAKEKNIKIVVTIDPALPNKMYGDSVRLSQILLNLAGNAVKFTEKGEILITATLIEETPEGAICLFSVIDTGIGIPENKLNSIFESFTQASLETTRKYGGTGLGLTISKNLVEMQGGSIMVESKEGKGSTFSFQLTFKKIASINNISKSEEPDSINADKKLKILLVEDLYLNQRLAKKIIEAWGHELDIADNGKIAIDKIINNTYDIILMDIQMPEMNGYETVQHIRSMADAAKQKIPIVALTAHASNAEAEKCFNLGMNFYLAKPFNQHQLKLIINKFLSKDKEEHS